MMTFYQERPNLPVLSLVRLVNCDEFEIMLTLREIEVNAFSAQVLEQFTFR